jgi:hypothetical protein
MRRAFSFVALALVLACIPGKAGAIGIGIGAFGGTSIPVSQEDVKTGGTYGIRIPLTIIPLVSVEPYWGESKLGDGTQTVGGVTTTVDGFHNTSFGVNAMLGSLMRAPGIKFYPYIGIASTKLTRSGFEDIKKSSYNFGLGGAVGLAKLALHGRAEMNVIDTNDKTRKFANLTVGLSYDIFSKL